MWDMFRESEPGMIKGKGDILLPLVLEVKSTGNKRASRYTRGQEPER